MKRSLKVVFHAEYVKVQKMSDRRINNATAISARSLRTQVTRDIYDEIQRLRLER
jgi:hypothetical protein